MAKGDRCADDQPGEVRERRNVDTMLGVIRERGRHRLLLDNISRQLYNRNLYLQAYGRLYRHDGAMTPGAATETIDAMSLAKIDAIIDALRHERYRWPPVRRVYLEKQHSMKKRPLGLPTWTDKRRPEVIRAILAAYYDPQFSSHSHGFRPGRGGHTALGEITKRWQGVKWFIEGDIAQCFDSLAHQVRLAILRERFHDQRFLRLIAHLRKAGSLEDWRFQATFSGVPQGGVVSPILSHLYLDRLDQCVETVVLPAYNRGDRRRPYPPYMARLKAARKSRMAGKHTEAKALRRQAQRLPSRDPNDPHFRRLWYVRYADDGRLGLRGPREEAEASKGQLGEFLRETRHLTLSHAKTLITNARTEAARVLGDEIVNQHADDKQSRA